MHWSGVWDAEEKGAWLHYSVAYFRGSLFHFYQILVLACSHVPHVKYFLFYDSHRYLYLKEIWMYQVQQLCFIGGEDWGSESMFYKFTRYIFSVTLVLSISGTFKHAWISFHVSVQDYNLVLQGIPSTVQMPNSCYRDIYIYPKCLQYSCYTL